MNQRIHNLSKWSFLREGNAIRYEKETRRVVILEVNCPEPVNFYIVQDKDDMENNPERVMDLRAGRDERPNSDPVEKAAAIDISDVTRPYGKLISFVAACGRGRDRLEFSVDGAFDLLVEGGHAYVFTHDGEDIATRIVAPVIFTRIAMRKERNPHVEMMMYQQRLNNERMQVALLAEVDRRGKALERQLREKYAPERAPRKATQVARAEAARSQVQHADDNVDDVDGAEEQAREDTRAARQRQKPAPADKRKAKAGEA